jgi:protease-4
MYITRESVFISALRCFCIAFAAILGVTLAVFLVVVGFAFLSNPVVIPERANLVVAPDAQGHRELLPSNAPVVLRIDFHGEIGVGDLKYQVIENILLDSQEDLLRNGRVKAILLHMNTPGGAADDADVIYRLLMNYKQKYKVPIYAFVEGLCASGGVYITSAADKIFATPASIIGSVGVLMGPIFNVSKLMDNWGVESRSLTQGKDKDMLNPFRPWQTGEDACLQTITASLYDQFVSIVVNARPRLDRDKLINEYGAQVYLSMEAQNLGYIDVADADYGSAISELTTAAGISNTTSYQVFKLVPQRRLLDELTYGSSMLLSGKITHTLQIGTKAENELSGKFLYLYQPIH